MIHRWVWTWKPWLHIEWDTHLFHFSPKPMFFRTWSKKLSFNRIICFLEIEFHEYASLLMMGQSRTSVAFFSFLPCSPFFNYLQTLTGFPFSCFLILSWTWTRSLAAKPSQLGLGSQPNSASSCWAHYWDMSWQANDLDRAWVGRVWTGQPTTSTYNQWSPIPHRNMGKK